MATEFGFLDGIKTAVLALGIALAATAFVMPQAAEASNPAFMTTKGRVAAPKAAKGLCATYRWACASSSTAAAISAAQLREIGKVNTRINRTIRPVSDRRQYGVEDRWAVPTRRGGDCEDYALAKKQELVRMGIAPQRLLIATVLDRDRAPHAVLVFRSDEGDLVLDNLTDRIRSWSETRYLFLRMQDPARPASWVNVYLGG